MKLAALLIGIFMMTVGVVGLVVPSPDEIRAYFGSFTATAGGLYVVAAARIAIGLVFIRVAPASRSPRFLRGAGAIALALGVMTALVSVEVAQAILKWELEQRPAVFRLAAMFWLLFGAYVSFAVSKRRAT